MSLAGDTLAEREVVHTQVAAHSVLASAATVTGDGAHREDPQFLVMTNPPLFTIAFSDCAPGRNAIPQSITQPRRSAHRHTQSVDSQMSNPVSNSDVEELAVTLRRASDETCIYWKTAIGQYMVHYMRHHDMIDEQFDLGTQWRIHDFPAGYALFTEPRIRTPDKAPHEDHYLFGFDADGERTITFRSPMEFVLHGVALVFGSIADCGCSVCNRSVRQKDIHRILIGIAPEVVISKPRRFSSGRPRRSRSSPSPTALPAPPYGDAMAPPESEDESASGSEDNVSPLDQMARVKRAATEPPTLLFSLSPLTHISSGSEPEVKMKVKAELEESTLVKMNSDDHAALENLLADKD